MVESSSDQPCPTLPSRNPPSSPPEEFDTLQLLKTGVYKDEVGRAWVQVVETLSTRTIAVLCAELRRSPHTSNETVEAARRAAEIVVHDRRARQQIEAEERLTSELIETQKRLSERGKTARRLTTAVCCCGRGGGGRDACRLVPEDYSTKSRGPFDCLI